MSVQVEAVLSVALFFHSDAGIFSVTIHYSRIISFLQFAWNTATMFAEVICGETYLATSCVKNQTRLFPSSNLPFKRVRPTEYKVGLSPL